MSRYALVASTKQWRTAVSGRLNTVQQEGSSSRKMLLKLEEELELEEATELNPCSPVARRSRNLTGKRNETGRPLPERSRAIIACCTGVSPECDGDIPADPLPTRTPRLVGSIKINNRTTLARALNRRVEVFVAPPRLLTRRLNLRSRSNGIRTRQQIRSSNKARSLALGTTSPRVAGQVAEGLDRRKNEGARRRWIALRPDMAGYLR
jgi:hypothetical protein